MFVASVLNLDKNTGTVQVFCFYVFNRGDTVSRRSPIKGVRPSPYTTMCD